MVCKIFISQKNRNKSIKIASKLSHLVVRSKFIILFCCPITSVRIKIIVVYLMITTKTISFIRVPKFSRFATSFPGIFVSHRHATPIF